MFSIIFAFLFVGYQVQPRDCTFDPLAKRGGIAIASKIHGNIEPRGMALDGGILLFIVLVGARGNAP